MAIGLTAAEQIAAIANSAYPTAIATETIEPLAFRALMERLGYTVLQDGTIIYNSVAAAEVGTEVVGNTVIETSLVEGSLTTNAVAAETTTGGRSLLAGAMSTQIPPTFAVAATAAALGLEVKSIHDYPEFWTDMSDAFLYGDTDVPVGERGLDLSLKEGARVIFRAIEDGGIAAYAEEKQIKQLAKRLYEEGAFQSGGELVPDITASGNYELHPGGASFYEAFAANRLPKPSAEALTFFEAFFNDKKTTSNAMVVTSEVRGSTGSEWCRLAIDFYDIPEGAHADFVKVGEDITSNTILPGYKTSFYFDWDFYTGDSLGAVNLNEPYAGRKINGSTSMGTIYSTINSHFIEPPEATRVDPNATQPTDPDDLESTYPDWYSNAFTVNRYNPETGENERHVYLPLRFINTNTTDHVDPGLQDDTQDGVQPGKSGNPDLFPDWILSLFNPGGTPNFPTNFNYPENPSGNTPVIVAPTSSLSTKLYTVYNPSDAKLDDLGNYLWDTSIIQQLVELFTNNPMDAIISLHQVYCTPSTGASKNIILGVLNSGVAAPVVTNQYVSIDCGSVSVNELYADARDYSGVSVDVFLPFIGMRSLDPNDVVGCTLKIIYHIDVYTGSCLAQLQVTKAGVSQVLYTFEGNCSVQIPLTSADRSRILNGIVTATTGLITGGAGAAIGAAATASLGGAAQTSIHKSSNFSGNAGAMGGKVPYIVVSRNKSADAQIYANLIGNPTNKSIYLKDCIGFTRVADVRIDITGITPVEIDMITSQLKRGIVI